MRRVWTFRASDRAPEFSEPAEGNRLEQPPGRRAALALMIHAAKYNSQRLLNRRLELSPKGSAGRREAKGPSSAPVR